MSVVRQSKFRHVFGTCVKRELCYENIRVSRSSLDSMACAVNPKFLAVIVESGGGAFIVLPLNKHGRVPPDYPLVDGHKGYITDIAFCPHDDNVIASASDDCTVKVWQIPDAGLSANMTDPVVDLIYHQRRVNLVLWHPAAHNVLLSAGSDNHVVVWDVGTGEVLCRIESHPDVVFSAAWNWNGSRLVTTCRDKRMRIYEPRTGEIQEEALCHEGSKATRAIYLRNGQIFTTGFSKMSEWQYSLREPGRLDKPLCLESNDSTNGIIFPLYDPDTNMMYLCGKGDSLIRYFEVTDEPPYVHFINILTTSDPQRGIGMMPKRGCDVRSCEVASFYRLTAGGLCQVISMKCPRKSDLFQEDLFPPTTCDQAALSAAEWSCGTNADPLLMSLRYKGAGHPPAAHAAVTHLKLPNVLNRMRSSSYANIARSSSSSDDDDAAPPASRASRRRAEGGKPVGRTRSVSGGYVEDKRSGEIRSPRVLRKEMADVVLAKSKEGEVLRMVVVKSEEVEGRSGGPRVLRKVQSNPEGEGRGEAPHARRLHAQLKTWPKCYACDEIIEDEEFTCAEERVYHVRHFSCCKCDKPLAGNDYYLVVATDLPMCVGCYQTSFVALTATV